MAAAREVESLRSYQWTTVIAYTLGPAKGVTVSLKILVVKIFSWSIEDMKIKIMKLRYGVVPTKIFLHEIFSNENFWIYGMYVRSFFCWSSPLHPSSLTCHCFQDSQSEKLLQTQASFHVLDCSVMLPETPIYLKEQGSTMQ